MNQFIMVALAMRLCGLISVAAGETQLREYSMRVWQAEDGLPENRIVGVAQGSDGYLWVATQVGAVRFDGVRFQPVRLPGGEGLFSGTTWGLVLGENGGLRIAKEGGVVVLVDGKEVTVLRPEDGLPREETQRSMATDAAGALWISYPSGRIMRVVDGVPEEIDVSGISPGRGMTWLTSDEDGIIWFAKHGRVGFFRDGGFHVLQNFENPAMMIGAAKGGGIWACGGQRMMRLDSQANLTALGDYTLTGDASGVVPDPTVIMEDSRGAVWVGTTSSGLFRCDANGSISVKTSHPGILSLAEDREKNLWVGTNGGGLNRLNEKAGSLINRARGLPFEGVRSLCRDTSGRTWAVGQNGRLAWSDNGKWMVQDPEPGAAVHVNCVEAAKDGTVWIGTREGSLFIWRNGNFTNMRVRHLLGGKSVRALLATSSGDLWIGTDEPEALHRVGPGGAEDLTRFELPQGYRYVRAMTEDASGTVWAGASDGLLVSISGNEVRTHQITGGLSIRALHAAANGDLWLGFPNYGAGRLRDGVFHRFELEEGLPNNFVSQILTDGRGGVWFAGNQGVFQIADSEFDDLLAGRVERVRPVIYGRNEEMGGLQASFDFTPAAVRTTDGRLLFSTLAGIAEVRLDQISENEVVPEVFIERVTGDQRVIDVYPDLVLKQENTSGSAPKKRSEIRLPAGVKLVRFEFSALSFVAPERSRFRYRLGGLDEQWVDGGDVRFAQYTQPSPGRYRFQVIASNNSGVWNETGDTLTVVIEAFFWETFWFRAGVVVLGTAGICALAILIQRHRHRRELVRIEHQRALEAERTRIARDLHDDLGVGLTEIGLLGDLAGNGEELQEISGRARSLAASLDEIVWAINPANDTSQSLVDYFFPYAQKLLGKASIRCRLEVVEPLPPGTLNAEERHEFFHAYKESLNNIIRHSGAGEVRIRFSTDKGMLLIKVSDDGCGLQDLGGKGSHHGLAGMRGRLQRLGGHCEIESNLETGTAISFFLPVESEKTS